MANEMKFKTDVSGKWIPIHEHERLIDELRRLHEVNAELVEALKLCAGWVEAYGRSETKAVVGAAIAKATGEQQ